MEADWIRLRSIAVASLNDKKVRQWFLAQVPDEDETSDDDDWLQVADVFITVEAGVVTQIEVMRATNVDEIFEGDAQNGRLEEVVIDLLKPMNEIQFALDVPLLRSTLLKEPALVYHSDLDTLV